MLVRGTDAAARIVERARRERAGALVFTIGTGCCESTAPFLYEDFWPGPDSEPVGEVAGVAVYAPKYLRSLYPDDDGVVIDVDDGLMAESMSIETEYGCRFVLRGDERVPFERVIDANGACDIPEAVSALRNRGPQELPESLRRAHAVTDELLVAEGVRKIYRTGAETVDALRGVDLVVHEGEFVSVMGPSGSGKTTLLNCCSGLDDVDGGRVCLDGIDLHALSDAQRTSNRASSMGFIFQAYNLIPVFSAVENVELPGLLAGLDAKEARRRAHETLERVGLADRARHRPGELSGGEQQRVTVARALAGNPRVVWADEPTGALDSDTAQRVMELLCELNAEGLTLILVTHDEGVGMSANRLVRMRDGAIVSDERVHDGLRDQ